MFAIGQTPAELKDALVGEANRFTPEDKRGQSHVAVTYDDELPAAVWSADGHPINTRPGPADERVVNAAWTKAILDYRSLLETNYDHGDEEVNLFHVCVLSLLRDYVIVGGGRLGEVWQRLSEMLERGQIREAQLKEINDDSRLLNNGLPEALGEILPLINPILDDLGYGDIRVTRFSTKRIASTLR